MHLELINLQNVSSSVPIAIGIEVRKIVSRTYLQLKILILDTNFTHFNRKIHSN